MVEVDNVIKRFDWSSLKVQTTNIVPYTKVGLTRVLYIKESCLGPMDNSSAKIDYLNLKTEGKTTKMIHRQYTRVHTVPPNTKIG